MKAASSKDYFAILGVEPTAAPEEIRKAYLDRAREIHPDRFDLRTEPAEWRQANDALALLNEAYAALRGGATWASGAEPEGEQDQSTDRWPSGWDEDRSEAATPEPPPFDVGEMTAGEASFDQLPRSTQARLLARQNRLTQDQWTIRRQTPLRNGAGIAVLLCWFLYLFFEADRSEWVFSTLMSHAIVTTAAGPLMGRYFLGLMRWARSALKPALYLTPLYFIRTGFDVVSFFPIWTLGNVTSVKSRKVFWPGGRQLRIQFGPDVETLRFASRRAADEFEIRLRDYERTLREALEAKRFDYLAENDDFLSVRRQPRAAGRSRNRWGDWSAFVLALLTSWVAFGLAIDHNMNRMQERSIRFPGSLTAPRMADPQGQVDRLDRPIPEDAVVSPGFESRGGRGSMSPTSADGLDPLRQSDRGQSSFSAPPDENLATSQDYKGFVLDSGASDGSEGSIEHKFREVRQLPTPVNGHLTRYHDAGEALAPLEIRLRDAGRNLLLTMEDWESRRTILTAFVRGGQAVRFNVPLGSYRLKYAAGGKWYGENHLFGVGTVYGASSDRVDFTMEGDKVKGLEVEISLEESGFQAGQSRGE